MERMKLVCVPDSLESLKCHILCRIRNQNVPLQYSHSVKKPTLYLDSSTIVQGFLPISLVLNPSEARNPKISQWIHLGCSELRPFHPHFITKNRNPIISELDRQFLTGIFASLDRHLRSSNGLGRLTIPVDPVEQMTLADVSLALDLMPFPSSFFSDFGSVQSWYQRIISDPKFQLGIQEFQNESKILRSSQSGKRTKGTSLISSTSSSQKKKKILCLHGYRQSDSSFREKLGAFRKIVGKKLELVFVTAPHRIGPSENNEFGWWFSQDNCSYDAHETSNCDLGFNESIDFVTDILNNKSEEGSTHFDGILAFSQGAALLTILCLRRKELNVKFNFAILIAPFKSRISQHSNWFGPDKEKSIDIPSLIVIGQDDQVIEREMSDEVLKYFNDPRVMYHTGGHYVPAKAENKKVYLDFLENLE